MKKIIKKSILTATSLISIGGSAATVVACGVEPEKKADDAADGITKFKDLVGELVQELNEITLTFEADKPVTHTVFLAAVKDVLSNFYDNKYYSDIDFSNITVIGSPEDNVITDSTKNKSDGAYISYTISASSIKDPKNKSIHKVDTTYDLSGRPLEAEEIGSLEEWNAIIDNMSLTFTETTEHKFVLLSDPKTDPWPSKAGFKQAHYVYSTDGTNWITDREALPLLDYSTTIYVSIRANQGFQIGANNTPKSKPFTTIARPDTSLGSLIEWNLVIDSMTLSFTETKDQKFILNSPATEAWPNGTTTDQAHYVYSTDGTDWITDRTKLPLLDYSTKVYVSIRASQGFQIGSNETPKTKPFTTPAKPDTSLGTLEQWNKVISDMTITFTETPEHKFTIDQPSIDTWPNGTNLDQAHYVYSLDGTNWINDISEVPLIDYSTTVHVSIRANQGFQIGNQETPDSKSATTIAKPDTSLGSLEEWNRIIDNMKLTFTETTEHKFILNQPQTEGWPNGTTLQQAHYIYSTNGKDWTTDRASLPLLDYSTIVYVSIEVNQGFQIGSHDTPKSKPFTTPERPSDTKIGTVDEWNKVIDSIKLTFSKTMEEKFILNEPEEITWPNGITSEQAHYVYSLNGTDWITDRTKIPLLDYSTLDNDITVYVSIRANPGFQIGDNETPKMNSISTPTHYTQENLEYFGYEIATIMSEMKKSHIQDPNVPPVPYYYLQFPELKDFKFNKGFDLVFFNKSGGTATLEQMILNPVSDYDSFGISLVSKYSADKIEFDMPSTIIKSVEDIQRYPYDSYGNNLKWQPVVDTISATTTPDDKTVAWVGTENESLQELMDIYSVKYIYSVDGGETWIQYTGPFSIPESRTILFSVMHAGGKEYIHNHHLITPKSITFA